MRAAVIANPSAGGRTEQGRLLRELKAAWPGVTFMGVRGFGGEELDEVLAEVPMQGYVARFGAAMEALMAEKPELLVCIGGDGTAAYAADWLVTHEKAVPILGLAAGTANVGPIVTEHDCSRLPALEKLGRVRMGAVEACTPEGAHIAFGFNDLVLGNTLLGTENGETVTLDACAMAKNGEKRICSCLPSVAGPSFRVRKNGQPVMSGMLSGVGQIIASPVERERFYGRAVTGALCFTPDSPYQAAVCIPHVPIIRCEDFPEGFSQWLSCAQLLLCAEDHLEISGLLPEVCAVADGNPCLLPENGVILRYRPDLITVLTRR